MHDKILKAAIFTPGLNGRWGLPLLLEGKPGTAKTSRVYQLAQDHGLSIEVVIASLREPADFLGLPIPNEDGTMRYAAPSWADRLRKAKRGVAFLDELNTAPPAVQAATLRVVLDGAVGDLVLPSGIRFIAAQNATYEAAGGWDLAPPLANRFGHIRWENPDVDSWSDWLLTGGSNGDSKFDAGDEEERVLKCWNNPHAIAKGLVTSYIRRRPSHLHAMPKLGNPEASRAWPSPRTWEMATRALASASVHELSQVEEEEFVSAFVGAGTASEFFGWREKTDLPDPGELLDGKVKFRHEEKRLDRTLAIFSACAALVAPSNAEKRNPRAIKLWTLLDDVASDAADVIVPAARTLVKSRLATMPEARNVLMKLNPILAAAGVVPQ
jgi:MoxR-like ATPase